MLANPSAGVARDVLAADLAYAPFMLIVELLINGILLGGLYTCLGMSFSLIWGVMNLINLAHGTMIIMGSYVAFVILTWLGWDPFLAIPVSALVLFAFGYAVQRYIINMVVRRSIFMTLILTFGLDLLLVNILLLLFTADTRSITLPYSAIGVTLGTIRISYVRIAVFAIAIALVGLLAIFLNSTRLGNAIKATSFDQEAAQLMGVEIRRIFPITFAIGAAMAGAVGPLLAVTYTFSPVLGNTLTMKAFVVVVLGGLGNVPGAIAGGLALGVAEHLSTLVVGSGYQDFISFAVLLTTLVLRPQGFFGKKFFAELQI